jgi:excisionase family DNA binding protein
LRGIVQDRQRRVRAGFPRSDRAKAARNVHKAGGALKFLGIYGDQCGDMNLATQRSRDERRLVFTSSQAASYLGVSLATVRRWTDAGHISCYRTPGGQRRFSRDQLDTFVSSMQRSRHPVQAHVGPRPSSHAA